MTQTLTPKPLGLTKTNDLPIDPKQRAELMLREIAFVLKMTEKIRDEIDAEEPSEELVLA